jgi:hypothetical protein
VAILFLSQVAQLDDGWHLMQVDNLLIFIVVPIGHGQSFKVSRVRKESHDKHFPRLVGSQVRQFFVH